MRDARPVRSALMPLLCGLAALLSLPSLPAAWAAGQDTSGQVTTAARSEAVGLPTTGARRRAERPGSGAAAASAATAGAVTGGASSFAVPGPRLDPGSSSAVVGRVSLTLDAVATARGPSVPATWSVLALGDPPRTVFSSHGKVRPTVHLGPGRYELRVAYGAVRLNEQFEIPVDAPAAREVRRVVLNAGTLVPTASLAAGAPPLDGQWSVAVEAVPERRPGDIIATSTAREPVFHLPPGRYRLHFQSGQVRAEAVVRLAAGRTVYPRLVLRAADITLVSLRDGRPLLGVRWQVFERPRGGGPISDAPLADSAAPRARFVLPAGSYVARVLADGRWYEQLFAIAPGTVREIPLALP